jgi:hypothetical protein
MRCEGVIMAFCAICQEDKPDNEFSQFPCQGRHSFCKDCSATHFRAEWQRWAAFYNRKRIHVTEQPPPLPRCPMCRQEVTLQHVQLNQHQIREWVPNIGTYANGEPFIQADTLTANERAILLLLALLAMGAFAFTVMMQQGQGHK